MILVKELSVERSNKKIFENINLSLGSGKIILLKGKNGSGKTTLLKTIINIIEPSSGSIYWKGKPLKKIYMIFTIILLILEIEQQVLENYLLKKT